MRLTIILFCLASIFGLLTNAGPIDDPDEAAASRQIGQWQRQYNQFIEETVKSHHSGCTSENIVYRQEW